jgi:hypothetical protein
MGLRQTLYAAADAPPEQGSGLRGLVGATSRPPGEFRL